MSREIKFEYGFESVNGIIKKVYHLHEIPDVKDKCDVWGVLPLVYIRQFTKVKDEDGVDIYEGDKLDNEEVVKYSTEQACYFAGEVPLCMSNSHRKVVGNIHENKN